TVREAGNLWLASCAHIERATAVTYKQHLDLHIYPYLGQHRLAHLTPPLIRPPLRPLIGYSAFLRHFEPNPIERVRYQDPTVRLPARALDCSRPAFPSTSR